MDALAQTALLVALTSFSLGFGTLARNVRNKLFILFAIGCTAISAWAVFYFVSSVWPDNGWYGWHLAMNAWLSPFALAFIQSMARVERWKTSRALLVLSVVGALAGTAAVVAGMESDETIRNLLYFAPTFVSIQLLVLMLFDREIDPVIGGRKRYPLYLVTLAVLATTTMDHVPALWVGVPVFGNLLLTALLFFLSQAITQQRLLNLRALVSRFFVMVVIALLLASVYALVGNWAREFSLYFLNSFIASFFLLTLLEPVRTVARFSLERVFAGGAPGLRTEIDSTAREIAAVVNPKDALTVFERFVTRTLEPRGIAFYVPSADPRLFRRERQVVIDGDTGIPRGPSEIPKTFPAFEALMARGEPGVALDQRIEDEIERMAGRETKGRLVSWLEAIRALGGNIVFPFQKEGRILGIGVIDAPHPPEAYGENWSILRDLEPLADRVGEALAKLSVFDREREVERLATLGEMAAGLAHEIRNPLGAIKGAAQYLDPTQDRPESRFLRVIQEEADRLNAVVTQFLDYAKPAAQRESKEIDLNALIQKIVTFLSPTAPDGVDLRFQSSLLSARIRCAPEQIHQVLLNLVQNAFMALRRWDVGPEVEKRVVVSLDSFETEDLRPMVRVTVEDNGPGIPKENAEKIFIPFFTTDPSGTGLGLPICKKIVQAHGGTIEIHSVPGVTTQFRVILPMADEGKVRA
jgi:signal transduction histidine kinase